MEENTNNCIKDHNKIWYQKVHDAIIDRGKTRGLNKKKLKEQGDNNYYHKHHIIPKCMGGENKKSNYVLLTFREHVIIHKILVILYPDSVKLKYAVHILMNVFITNPDTGEKEQYKLKSSREAEYYYNLAKGFMGENNPHYGKHHSEETKKKVSKMKKGIPVGPFTEEHKRKIGEGNKGKRKGYKFTEEELDKYIKSRPRGENHPNYGKHLSEEVRKKISDTKKLNGDGVGEKNHFYGKKHTEETRLKMSKGQQKNRLLISERMKKKVIGPDGTIYNSMSETALKLSINVNTLRNWIVNHPEKGWKYYK